MTTWACAGRTNPAIAASVTVASEASRRAAVSYVDTAFKELAPAIEKGTPLSEANGEAIRDAVIAVGSARQKFFALLFSAELGEAAESCGSRSSLDLYDCSKTRDILTCAAASQEPFSTLAGWMTRETEGGTTAKERRSLLDAARGKVVQSLWKKLP
jgi:hypothetical protein